MRTWALCSRSWAALGPYVGGLGPLLGPMWPKNATNMATLNMGLFLERERDLRPPGRSWAALGSSVGGLGPLLVPMLPVLGRSWALCSRSSWLALGAYVLDLGVFVGGPGPWMIGQPKAHTGKLPEHIFFDQGFDVGESLTIANLRWKLNGYGGLRFCQAIRI